MAIDPRDTRRVHGSARVRIEVELDGLGGWGPDCPISQINAQAYAAAVERLRKIMEFDKGFRIVGQAKVTAVITETE